MDNPDRIFCGKRDAVIAEYGGLAHIYPGKYLIQPDGNGNYDADGVDTLKDLKELVADYRRIYPGIEVCWL